jgi:hypothetical protein
MTASPITIWTSSDEADTVWAELVLWAAVVAE